MPNNDKRQLNNSVNQFEYTASIVCSRTPVIFSTSHGIHLRTSDFSGGGSINNNNGHASTKYRLQFCDLERWQRNGNKVDSIGLSSVVDQSAAKSDKVKVDALKQRAKGVTFVTESAGSSSASNVSK